MEKELNYPEVTLALDDDESDIDVHIVGEGLFTSGDESANDTAEFIDLDSDGEIDAVLIDIPEEFTEDAVEIADNAMPELEVIPIEDGMQDSGILDDPGDADMGI